MKLSSIKTLSAAMISSTLLFSACNELTDGFSTDPVNITDPSIISTDKFLSGAEVSLIGIYEADINRLTGMWTDHFSGEDRQYIGLSNYSVSGRDFNTEWGGIYSGVVKNAHIIKDRANYVDKNPHMVGVAQVMEAMAIGLAADLWGDVPFTERTLYPEITTPKFDDQAAVYAGVQTLLDSAINNLSVAANTIPSKYRGELEAGDFFFGGDASKWTAVANTLKARFYLHTKNYANAVTFANLGVADASGNLMAPHGASYLQNFNLFYSFMNYDRPGYMGGSGYAPELLDSTTPVYRGNDKTDETARLNYLYLPGAGVYVGGTYEPNFLSAADGWVASSDEDGFFGTTTSFPMVTYEENQLILAEAYAKQDNFDDALDALNDYRAYLNAGGYWSAAYNDYGVLYDAYDAADFEAGGSQNAAGSEDATAALVREIIEERYITLTGQLEVFNDVRRTQNLLGIPVKAGNTTIPLRLLYPQSEINTNPNVPKDNVGLFQATDVNSTSY